MRIIGYIGARRHSDLDKRFRTSTFATEICDGNGWAVAAAGHSRHGVFSRDERTGFAVGRVYARASSTNLAQLTLDDLLLPAGRSAWGSYAAAAYNTEQECVTLVTDPLRLKHMFYTREKSGAWIFATRMEDLFTLLGEQPECNMEYLLEVFNRTWYPPRNTTPFHGVHAVEAGCAVSLTSRGSHTRVFYNPFDLVDPHAHEIKPKQLAETLVDATRTVTADTSPITISLSGGIDSSAVAWAATQTGKPIRAVHKLMTRNDPGGEWEYAYSVAKHLGIELTEVDVREELTQFLLPPGEQSAPFPSRTLLASSATTAPHHGGGITLEGEGGDAVFNLWTHPWHVHDHLLSRDFSRAREQLWEHCMVSGTPLVSVVRQLLGAELRRVRGRTPSTGHDAEQEKFPRPKWLHAPLPTQEHVFAWRVPRRAGAGRSFHVYGVWANAFRRACEISRQGTTFCIPLALPVVELMLRTPMHQLADVHENNRPLLRAAVAPHLPESVVQRWGKGETSTSAQNSIARQLHRAEQLIKEGILADMGVVDAASAVEDLHRAGHGSTEHLSTLLDVLVLELWREQW